MAEKNKLFLGIKPGDSKDLLINLIDSLLTELKHNNLNNLKKL